MGCTFSQYFALLVTTLLTQSVPDLFCESPSWSCVNKPLAFVLVIAVAAVIISACILRMSQALARRHLSCAAANAICINAANCQARAAASDSLVCHRCSTPWGYRVVLLAAKQETSVLVPGNRWGEVQLGYHPAT